MPTAVATEGTGQNKSADGSDDIMKMVELAEWI